MPDICIFVGSMNVTSGGDTLSIYGEVVADGVDNKAEWTATPSWNATPAQINSAIVTAAIAAAESVFEITVDILDNRSLIAGAVGLL